MAKEKPQTENNETANNNTAERAERGTSFNTLARNMFIALMTEYATVGGFTEQTLKEATELYENAPNLRGVTLPIDVQLANIEIKLADIYDNKAKVIDGVAYFDEATNDLRVKLLALKAKLEKEKKKEEKTETEKPAE